MAPRKDHEATIAQMYLDNRSYLAPDGREVLFGEDWTARKKELWARCKGWCEHKTKHFIGCNAPACDAHHIIPRSKGRDDRLHNLQALCRYHHQLIDKRKPRWGRD